MAGLTAFALALGIVFLAEFADKTQFAVLAMASRGHPLRVWAGASAAFTVLAFSAALLGAAIGDRVPLVWMAVAAGAAFIVLGIVGLVRAAEEEAERRGVGFAASFVLILLAEMGDRTQIAVLALAARNGHPWLTGLGAAIALVAVAGIAVVAGRWLQDRLPRRRLERIANILFIVVGASFLAAPWLGRSSLF